MNKRLQKLLQLIDEKKYDIFIITDPLNVRYISGYTGSCGRLVITKDKQFIISDSRYELQCGIECPDFQLILMNGIWEISAINLIHDINPTTIAFEGDSLTYNEWFNIKSAIGNINLIQAENMIAKMRLIKDANEIDIIKQAIEIADKTFTNILSYINIGITEKQLSAEIDCELRRNGADRESFDTIAISGNRTALIHGQASDKLIELNDLILMDYGARYKGYNSDITRTVVAGKPTLKQVEIYKIVLESQIEAIGAIKPGMIGSEIDAIARDIITKYGYGEYFGHGLGHGIGLHIHDSPAFSKFSSLILEPGMICTVEPGIYIPDWGGIRIEDNILVTESGCEILTKSVKSIQ